MDISLRHTILGSIEFDSSARIELRRGFDVCSLLIPIRRRFEASTRAHQLLLADLAGELMVSVGDKDRSLLGSGRMKPPDLRSATTMSESRHPIEIRCSPRALAQFEEARTGAEVRFRLQLVGNLHEVIGMDCEEVKRGREVLSAPEVQSGFVEVEVPRETWGALLRSVGLSAPLLLELPTLDLGGSAQQALTNALNSFESGRAGAWKDAVGHIRPYLEKWRQREPLPSRKPPEDGSDTDHKYKLLNLRDALYKCCCLWVHESAETCARPQALLIITTFVGLLQAHSASRAGSID